MKKIKKYWFVLLIILLFAGLFYWLLLRPIGVKKACKEKANKEAVTMYYPDPKLKHIFPAPKEYTIYEPDVEKRGILQKEKEEQLYLNCLKVNGL